MIKFIKLHKIKAILILSFYIVFMSLTTWLRLDNYGVVKIGGTSEIKNEIKIENDYETKGSLHSLYVYTFSKPTIFQFIISKFSDKIELTDYAETSYTVEEITELSKISKDESITDSLIVAYENAPNASIEYESEATFALVLESSPNTHIKYPSKILKIDDIPVNTRADFTSYLSSTVQLQSCDISFDVEYLYNDEIIKDKFYTKTSGDSCVYGTYIIDKKKITKSNPAYNYEPSGAIGGSAGLMQTLSLYNNLIEKDLTNGLKVAGTGTIDIHGNVGPIGGAYQKVFGAENDGMDLLFILDDSEDEKGNYNEAKRAYDQLKTNMKLVKVKTFKDALDYLMELE